MKRKLLILPKIYKPKNRTTQGWFVYFSVYSQFTGRMKRFKRKEGFSTCLNVKECEQNAKELMEKYREKLLSGWNPCKEENIIWEDKLSYVKKEVKLNNLVNVQITHKSIEYYISKYLFGKKANWSKGTYDKSQSELRKFQAWLKKRKYDKIHISEFDIEKGNEFFRYLKDEKELKGSTLNGYKITVDGVWRVIIKENDFINSPWSEVPHFKLKTKPQKPLNRGAISILKVELEKKDPQLWLAAQFMYYCFIRPKELRFLQIKDIDLYEGRISLTGEITKNRKARTVEVSNEFLEILLNKYKLHKFPDHYYIFTLKKKPGIKPIGKNYFWNHFDAIRKDLNLPKEYKFYSFKHTGAVAALKAGADIKDIQHQMGHSSIQITDEYLKSMVGYESEFFKKKMPTI